jgi:O-antigen/teichoic acid export membrane protein
LSRHGAADGPEGGAPSALATTRRGAWVVLDQAVSSLTNFGLSVVVLRAVGPREFGAFTLMLATYMVALCVWRAVGGDPQLVRHSHGSVSEGRGASQAAAGLALAMGVAGGALLLAASVVIGGIVGSALAHLAVVLPGLLLQDAWRYTFFASHAPARALVNDLTWALIQAAFTAWVLLGGHAAMTPFILAWGCSATVAAGLGAWQAGTLPRPGRAWGWLRDHRDLGPRFAAESGIALAAWQGGFVAIGAVAGLGVLGTVNAARVVLGPFNLLALGVVGFAVPEGAAIWRRSPERLRRATALLGGGLALAALVCSALVFVLPDRLGTELLGQSWRRARDLLPLVGLWVAAESAGQGARIGLMVLGEARGLLRARAVTAPLILAGGPAGAALGGARGAAIGLAVAHLLGARYWWHVFSTSHRHALDERAVPPEPDAPVTPTQVDEIEPWLSVAEGERP